MSANPTFSSTSPSPFATQKTKALALIVLGPPGAGKGTVAHLLCDKLSMPHVSTGNLLRQHTHQNTELGKASLVYADQGLFVPDELIFNMLFERIEQKDCQRGHILDGFPRTLTQAKTYQKRLGKHFKIVVIHLDISDQEVINRLAHRLICSACNTPYNLITAPPKIAMTCDTCCAELIQRADDRKEVVTRRLSTYYTHTSPLTTYYSKQNILKTVACSRPTEMIVGEVLSMLSLT